MKTGIELIAQERDEQINKHGRTIEKDVAENSTEQLKQAAQCLLMEDEITRYELMPIKWDNAICERMANKPYKERLIIAGALIAAEIDRINNS